MGQVYIQNVSTGQGILNLKKKNQKSAPVQELWVFVGDSVIPSRNGSFIGVRYECRTIKRITSIDRE